jgi:hypothetical protein
VREPPLARERSRGRRPARQEPRRLQRRQVGRQGVLFGEQRREPGAGELPTQHRGRRQHEPRAGRQGVEPGLNGGLDAGRQGLGPGLGLRHTHRVGQLQKERGVALGPRQQRLGVGRLQKERGVALGPRQQRPRRVLGQRPQIDVHVARRVAPGGPATRGLGPLRGQHEDRPFAHTVLQLVDQGLDLGREPVQVVDEPRHGRLQGQRRDDLAQGHRQGGCVALGRAGVGLARPRGIGRRVAEHGVEERRVAREPAGRGTPRRAGPRSSAPGPDARFGRARAGRPTRRGDAAGPRRPRTPAPATRRAVRPARSASSAAGTARGSPSPEGTPATRSSRHSGPSRAATACSSTVRPRPIEPNTEAETNRRVVCALIAPATSRESSASRPRSVGTAGGEERPRSTRAPVAAKTPGGPSAAPAPRRSAASGRTYTPGGRAQAAASASQTAPPDDLPGPLAQATRGEHDHTIAPQVRAERQRQPGRPRGVVLEAATQAEHVGRHGPRGQPTHGAEVRRQRVQGRLRGRHRLDEVRPRRRGGAAARGHHEPQALDPGQGRLRCLGISGRRLSAQAQARQPVGLGLAQALAHRAPLGQPGVHAQRGGERHGEGFHGGCQDMRHAGEQAGLGQGPKRRGRPGHVEKDQRGPIAERMQRLRAEPTRRRGRGRPARPATPVRPDRRRGAPDASSRSGGSRPATRAPRGVRRPGPRPRRRAPRRSPGPAPAPRVHRPRDRRPRADPRRQRRSGCGTAARGRSRGSRPGPSARPGNRGHRAAAARARPARPRR